MSPRQKAVMWGGKRLSVAMSEEGTCFLRVGVCFHSCEGEQLAKRTRSDILGCHGVLSLLGLTFVPSHDHRQLYKVEAVLITKPASPRFKPVNSQAK